MSVFPVLRKMRFFSAAVAMATLAGLATFAALLSLPAAAQTPTVWGWPQPYDRVSDKSIAWMKNVEHNVIRAARCLGASEMDVLLKVVFRAAMPHIVTGVRVGLGVGWMALVAAELVGATSGLGWLISDARSVLRTDIILVGMISVGFAGLMIDQGLRWAARKLLPWSLAMTK